MDSKKWIVVTLAIALLIFAGVRYAPYVGTIAREKRQAITNLVPEERSFMINGKSIKAQVAYGPPSGMIGMAVGQGVLRYRKADVKSLVGLTNTPARTLVEGDINPTEKDVLIKAPTANSSDFNSIVHQVAEEVFQVKVATESRSRTCLVLKPTTLATSRLQESVGGNGAYTWEPSNPKLAGKGMTIAQLAVALEGILGIPVIDESTLPGKYDIDIEIAPVDPDVAQVELSEQLGIAMALESRKINTTVVRPISKR